MWKFKPQSIVRYQCIYQGANEGRAVRCCNPTQQIKRGRKQNNVEEEEVGRRRGRGG